MPVRRITSWYSGVSARLVTETDALAHSPSQMVISRDPSAADSPLGDAKSNPAPHSASATQVSFFMSTSQCVEWAHFPGPGTSL